MVTTAVFADWNLGPGRVESIARTAEGSFIPGHGVDNAIVKGAEVTVTVLSNHGSDHPAVLYRLTLPNGEVFRVLAWNVYVGQKPEAVAKQLSRMIDHYQPHAVALSEAYRCWSVLGRIAGYKRHQGLLPLGENRDCALLLRKDLTVVRSGIRRMRQRWIGPKHSLDKGPRCYPYARVRTKKGSVVRLMAAHLPFGDAAVTESIDRIVAWATAH